MVPSNLQGHVLDPLRSGDIGIPQGLATFTGSGGNFENTPQDENHVRAFIITQIKEDAMDDNEIQHEQAIGKIRTLLHEVLGRDDEAVITYVGIDKDEGNEEPYGKVLLQYDPIQAWSQSAGCTRQIARLELWHENNPQAKYTDSWEALPEQQPGMQAQPPESSPSPTPGNSQVRRFIRGQEAKNIDEEWKEYAAVLERRGNAICSMPNSNSSPASTWPSSSVFQNSTTFGTSILPSLSVAESLTSIESSTPVETPTPSETPPPPETPTPTLEPPEKKSLQVIYERKFTWEKDGRKIASDTRWWSFYDGKQGEAVQACSSPHLLREETDQKDAQEWQAPDIQGEWSLPDGFYKGCVFQGLGRKGPSGDVGWLHCPGRPAVMCLEDQAKIKAAQPDHGFDVWAQCVNADTYTDECLAVAYCDFDA